MNIAIIGNGIAGITAARHLRQLSDCDITVISAESDYFFSRTALMYVYMGHLRLEDTKPYEDWFWTKNRIALRRARVEAVDVSGKKLRLDNGEEMPFDRLLIATGSKPNLFGWKGQDLRGVQGLYSLQDLEMMEATTRKIKKAVVVGGGLIGVEMAEMLHSRGISVTYLVRETSFSNIVLPPEESAMVNRHLQKHGIDLRLETELAEILDDGTGRACAVVTDKGERIDCQFVGLTAGVSPNVAFLQNTGIELGQGVLVNEFLETSVPGIFAAGDCAELRRPPGGRRAIEALWYIGRMMGETAAHNLFASLTGAPPVIYNPGIWYNSAKFFDIEYQIYGAVPPQLPDNPCSLYWEHPKGEKSIRIVFDKGSGEVVGFNLMGVRYRQEVCEKWIREGAHIEIVLENLALANFDPEFSKQYEKEMLDLYNRQTGKQLRLKQKRGLDAVLKYLGARWKRG